MLGHVLLDVDGLKLLEGRVQAASEAKTRLTTLRDRIAEDLTNKESEVERLTSEVEILGKVAELFKALMDQLIEKQVRVVEKVGSEGLQSVFPDLNLSLEADVDAKYNKIAVEFFIRKGPKDHPFSHRGRPLDSFGGGTSSFISLILRVIAVKKLKLWPVLMLDESLAAVSDEYIEATGQFIRKLSEKLGFDIILVTHKPAFADHAHVSYRCIPETEEDAVSSYVVLKKVS